MIGHRVRGTTRDGQAIPMSDTPLGDLAAAQRAVGFHEARGSTVRIFAVAEDGTETMLPTYEEALNAPAWRSGPEWPEDRSAKLAAIEAHVGTFRSRDDADAAFCVALEWATEEIRAADAALVALGIPDDGRPLAERIAALGERLAGALESLHDERRRDGGCECGYGCPSGCGCRSNGDEGDPAVSTGLDIASPSDEEGMRTLAGVPPAEECAALFEGAPDAAVAALEHLAADPALRAAFNASRDGQAPRIVLVPAENRGAFVRAFRAEHGIKAANLATALRVTETDVWHLEEGTRTTDAAGWLEITTTLFRLGAASKEKRAEEAGYIADPMSRPGIDRLLAEEEEDADVRPAQPPPEPDEADQTIGDVAAVPGPSLRLLASRAFFDLSKEGLALAVG